MLLRSLLITVSALTLSACAVGPDFVAPTPPVTASGPFLSTKAGVTSTAAADAEWWRLYKDPVLDGLVADALAANTDVRVAVARIAKARASLREVRGDRLPSTSLSAGATYGRVSEGQVPAGADRTGWQVDAGLTVGYEVDLFGRVSRGIEAARGDVAAAEADADAVRVTVAAETARAYADAASAAERLGVAERIVALLDKSVALTARRAEVGLTTKLDTARIAALRDQRRADIPAIAAERDAALFRLATLTGRAPAELPQIAAARTTTLRLDQPIPVGDGAALLARRPDVAAAERRLAASTARIGVATSDLYPKVTLGASVGQTSSGLGDLFGGGPLRWLLGPLINWNFLNQEGARARIAGAEADTQVSLATFDGTVLRALEETETALSSYAHQLDRRTALQAARDQAETAVKITRAQQREGAIDGLVALDAERTFAEAEASLALADARIADAQVDLFRALGGRWNRS
ncbi:MULTISPECIES: efflux transporter outer membrane subunit [unclassified Sphingopyxis]|uniref:efflux transporter outer membrane subunit n=1 Tax=unclassified Sphingopyxis TaxID=2614943 RepID=UPI0007305237|nr:MULTISPECIES: efflux transporter outer membrane subunit [unclassified Sphingopyxis]KTE24773.1 transporter [Sphingopyxis sp. H057]KTE50797.1 transporter [Sphingopyxis sp. H073]KTE51782.1 transporter [Sphingopyxis sp. H071]KTE58421.1 transporter [Sphingopyxis sp. H107]KTE64349.1 transporter [Sphingopyxis sp. H100]